MQKPYGLLEFMKTFRLAQLATLLMDIEMHQQECAKARDEAKRAGIGMATTPSQINWQHMMDCLEKGRNIATELGLDSAASQFALVRMHHEPQPDQVDPGDFSEWSADMRNVSDALLTNLWQRQVIQIEPELAGCINNDAPFGDDVKDKFADAIPDLRESGNCIAIDSGTAAVFHLMRAVEWGLRALCADLGILRVRRSYKKSNPKFAALEWTQWERMLEEAQKKIDKKIEKLGPSKRKQSLQQFYYPIMQDLKGFKDAFRNHVMHSRVSYAQRQALDIRDHVQRFRQALASGLTK